METTEKIKILVNGIQKRIAIAYIFMLILFIISSAIFSSYENVVVGGIIIIILGFFELISHSFKKINNCFSSGKFIYNSFLVARTGSTLYVVLISGMISLFYISIFIELAYGFILIIIAIIPFILNIILKLYLKNKIKYGEEKIYVEIEIPIDAYAELKTINYLIFRGDIKSRNLRKHLETVLKDSTYETTQSEYIDVKDLYALD